MSGIVECLKKPELVADIQKYFGIKLKTHEDNSRTKKDTVEFEVTNKFWYYLFSLGTALGDDVFYASFIPFWFWNVDGAVGRRFVLVWAIIMYIGQNIKDVVQWPRPGYPVVRLQKKWAMEYGMPSTHAMVAVSIPFSVVLYTMDRYQYNYPLGFAIAVIWCTIVCVSRLYLGMHTVLDIVVGLSLAVLLMFPLVPIVDLLDHYFLTSPTAPGLLLAGSIVMIVYYPNSGKWTPTRGDTTMILSVTVGVLIGAWLNFQTGAMQSSTLTPPYPIMWPSFTMFLCTILRTVIGFTIVIIGRQLSKDISYNIFCAILKEEPNNLKKAANSLQNKHKTIVDLGCKYVSCALLGFNTLYVLPHLFKLLRIERPTFITEM